MKPTYEELAVQLANAESKCRELAAENAWLNVFIEEECFVYSSHTPEPIDANDCKPETPATDAFLAEVRAQGVEMFALQQRHIAVEQEQDGDYEFSRHCSISATEAREFAEELREGKCCEVKS
ncbi:hypothetical protein [Citrobacter youngae]|uniref:hypothetical protein n=1 Tax=Citrobacter youngae TaxID=133448 RepID=UPI001866CE6A|nr:hypothetical protein [Citrobacter youngae]